MEKAYTTKWNNDWLFCEMPLTEESEKIPTDVSWQSVDIPHDYMIYNTHALYRNSIGWYKKEFEVDLSKHTQRIVRFDGVYMDSSVFVNGKHVMDWKYGYSMFEADITPYLNEGKNLLYVRIRYREPNTRWYSGAGIFRDVFFKEREFVHFASDGIYITEKKTDDEKWSVEIDSEIEYDRLPEKCEVKQELYNAEGKKIGESLIKFDEAEIAVSSEDKIIRLFQKLMVEKPSLWDIECGNLYNVRSLLLINGEEIETVQNKIGFKEMKFLSNEGFFLNGKKIKINGVCEHHDLGCLGAAFNKQAMRRKLTILRKMGVNAIRTAHNMPAEGLMELTDEMGFLVMSEAFDMWERPKTKFDYARFFDEWYEKDVRSWIRRDRNHVSVMMWSIGNEIPDVLDQVRGKEITKKLREAVIENDPKRHAPVVHGSNYMKWDAPQECSKELDCVGYNYAEYLYSEHHKKYPEWVLFGSETSSILSSRGVYHFPKEVAVLSDADEQCSSLGNSLTGWGAENWSACICDDRDAPFSLGQFLWSGFDYLGESTPYKTRTSYFGQIDTAGFPKDSFYVFKAAWTDYKTEPFVHIFPYWDFNIGQTIDVSVCTNAPKVELFVNGESFGRFDTDMLHTKEIVKTYKVSYKKGTIYAVAYDENGKIIAKDERTSFKDAVKLCLECDRTDIMGNGEDMAFYTVTAVDEDGNSVENANNRVYVSVSGEGRLVGIDNGNSADFDEHKGISRRMFAGKMLICVASGKGEGSIAVTVRSEGLESASLSIPVLKCEADRFVSANEENSERELYTGGSEGEILHDKYEVPIRKIEISVEGDPHMDPRLNEERIETSFTAHAKIYPKNATYREFEWYALTDSGIEVPYVRIENECADSDEDARVKVIALGDGRFRLRCAAKNGGSSQSVISTYDCSVLGMGKLCESPYEPMCMGLADYKNSRVSEGIEHGVNLLGESNEEKNAVCGFTKLDFGKYGSDTVTLSIFANTNAPVEIKLFEEQPEAAEKKLLYEGVYHKKPEWMVFKDETYTLSKKLTGITSFYIESKDSFQIRSFVFERPKKAYEEIKAAEADHIYGDDFVKNTEDGAVEKIGNNVVIGFEKLDLFEGASRIAVCSRSDIDSNTIEVKIAEKSKEQIYAFEVQGKKEYTVQVFEIEHAEGVIDATLMFMPGTSMDIAWIRFER